LKDNIRSCKPCRSEKRVRGWWGKKTRKKTWSLGVRLRETTREEEGDCVQKGAKQKKGENAGGWERKLFRKNLRKKKQREKTGRAKRSKDQLSGLGGAFGQINEL